MGRFAGTQHIVNMHVPLLELVTPDVFIEFIDVGGRKQYESSRSVFYDQLHGA